jgi:hypothetical protein
MTHYVICACSCPYCSKLTITVNENYVYVESSLRHRVYFLRKYMTNHRRQTLSYVITKEPATAQAYMQEAGANA